MAAIAMSTTPGTQRRSCAAGAVRGVHELCEWIMTGAAGRAGSVVASVYSASMASGSKPRNCAVVRTKPRLKTPPGKRSQCSVSRASRKRVPMRVAEEISSSVTPRISRSLRRWTPKPSFAVDWLTSCARGWSIEKEKEPEVTIGATRRGVNRRPLCRSGTRLWLGAKEAAEYETRSEVCVARGKTRRL